MRPVWPTADALYERNGIKKSLPLVVFPVGVASLILPDPTPAGTVAVIVVLVDAVTTPLATSLKRRWLSPAAKSKFVPEIVIVAPALPTAGVKPLMTGAPVAGPTWKALALVVLPRGDVTVSGPVDAPAGTLVTI